MTLSVYHGAALAYVRKNPGKRCEEIAEAIGVAPAITSIALRGLRTGGKLKSTGNTRGTRWRAA